MYILQNENLKIFDILDFLFHGWKYVVLYLEISYHFYRSNSCSLSRFALVYLQACLFFLFVLFSLSRVPRFAAFLVFPSFVTS